MSLTPPLFTSNVPDGPDATLLRPSDWNRVTGLLTAIFGTAAADGALLFRDSANANGAGWVPAAAGFVYSAGPGEIPVFRPLLAADIPQLAYSSLSGLPTLGNSAALNVGTGAGTVAAGDHLHAGVYEPAFATLAWSRVDSTPTTLGGYGITDAQPLNAKLTAFAALANGAGLLRNDGAGVLSWSSVVNGDITSLAWGKLTATPTTLAGYGIADPIVLTSGSYADPAWITSLAGAKITGTVPSATVLATPRGINGVAFDGSAAITVPAAAGTLTGAALAVGVLASSLTSVGTLTGGATGAGFTIALGASTVTGTLGADHGGTGLASYAVGDLLYASGTAALSKLPDVAAGSVLVSGGVGAAPVWSATPTVTDLTLTGVLKAANGLVGSPSMAFASQPGLGFYRSAPNQMALGTGNFFGVSYNSNTGVLFGDGRIYFGQSSTLSWTSGTEQGSVDLILARGGAGILEQRNGTNAQAFRPYGYISGARSGYGAVQTALASVTLSGATSTATNVIPAGAFVIGIATTTTTTITGATGYTVGDGSDVDRWGDIAGTAVGTKSQNSNATANPTGWFAAASNVVLTAKTSNFTGGVVQVIVFYLTTGAA